MVMRLLAILAIFNLFTLQIVCYSRNLQITLLQTETEPEQPNQPQQQAQSPSDNQEQQLYNEDQGNQTLYDEGNQNYTINQTSSQVSPRHLLNTAYKCDFSSYASLDDPVPPETLTFQQFLLKFKPNEIAPRDTQIFLLRQKTYLSNLNTLNYHNADPSRSFDMAVNYFADLSPQEFSQGYATFRSPTAPIVFAKTEPQSQQIIDWGCRAGSLITQGKCGACYVLAVLDSVQVTRRIYNKDTRELSVQEVLSCGEGKGCSGGYFQAVFKYVKEKGVGPLSFYPYDSVAKMRGTVSQCNSRIMKNPTYTSKKLFIKQSHKIPYQDCQQLINQLRFRSIAVAISTENAQLYSSGTLTNGGKTIDHGVSLIGYYPGKGFKIRNFWGVTWGEQGYGFVARETGVCRYGMYGIVQEEENGNRADRCC